MYKKVHLSDMKSIHLEFHVFVIHLNDDTVGYRLYKQCSKVIDKIII